MWVKLNHKKKKENKSPATIQDFSRSKEAAYVNIETEDEDPFWRRYEREQGHIEEWMSRRAEASSTKKKRKVKLCRSVYAKSRAVGAGYKQKKRQGKQSMQDEERRIELKFLASPNRKITGGSVGDSGIQNCNRCLKKQMQNQLAKEIWDLAKQLGAVAEDDREIIQRIEEMESKDIRAKAVMANHGTESKKKVSHVPGDFNAVRSIEERARCKGMSAEMREFDDFIHNVDLIDLPLVDLWKHLRIKERMWQQKSRMVWLKEGDANTKFFHRCMKGRSRRNEINCIQISGEQHTGVYEIKKEVAKYFKDLFTEEKWKRPKLYGINFKQISGADNELLTATFSEKEIKEAIWECGSSKAPGPDGFNFSFIKEMWEDIKVEIINFVQEFYKTGRIASGSNASFIVMIPKVENPQRIEKYRPISLIGVMYKIIAKLLANRLWKVLPKVIGEQQMAFIRGRQLVGGVVIVNEVIEEVKIKKKKSFLFKVDFEKVYDKVCWDFIEYMMMRMGFNATWRKWIRECLASSSISVLINGSPTNQFSVSKGLRQGDLLSPFLFLIVAEGLNGLMSSAVEKQLYKGVVIGNEGVSVSHLQFADDTIFFGEASEDNIGVIKSIMRTFELSSGLKINFGKSQLIGIGVDDNWRNKMAFKLCWILRDSGDGKCVLCNEEDEGSTHLFLKCKTTKWVWQECAKWWGIEILLERDCWKSFQLFRKWSKDPRLREGWGCIWSNLIWSMWLAWNQMIFQDKKIDRGKLLETIQLRSYQWVTTKWDRYAFSLSDWLVNPAEWLKGHNAGRRK
ncbi:hypothetical protein SLEP1_g34663 [Rubroshorea leprosula]|uniref:Reverse transcriptase domain-containing protein n=1 Tax=Rubroshorea leprosula TaxID=152421 RepID=A0AAV5KL34_9ROSI|nr:hypothetical protein SLEP1_g34663 [Rubroshorea leprosula]